MPITVLATKFYCPPVRESFVLRPRLVQRLQDGLSQPLVLISAPPGYGKSSLVSEWHASLGHKYPLAWLTLDEEDNDPARFLTYFISALQSVKPGLGEAALVSLQSVRPPVFKSVLTQLTSELCEHDQAFALVLDDYHVIEDESIHTLIAFMINHLPVSMHLIILTRVDPPLPFSKLRVSRRLCEIRTKDLRFTEEEATKFFNQVMRLDLPLKSIEKLEQSTEGWIAGLQLAALSMLGRTDRQSFISSFAGSFHYIADYLVEEVVNRQTEQVKNFLLTTSILERMNGSLCDAITGGTTGNEMLEKLDHDNLFLIPLDDQQTWYRYHHLFAELLQNRLWRDYPQQVTRFYRCASEWCFQNNLMPEAISYALEGADFELAAGFLEQYISLLQKRGEIKTLVGWLGRLPEDMLRNKPRLCIAYAWAIAYSSGSSDRVGRYLGYADQAIKNLTPSPGTQDLLGQIAAVQANVAVFLGDNQHAIQLCEQAERLLSEDNILLRSYNALMQADASWMMGQGLVARKALDESIRISRSFGDLQTALISMNYLARLFVAHGHLKQAKDTYLEALQLSAEMGGAQWPATGVIKVGLGMLYWEQNDAVTATEYLVDGIARASQAEDIDSLLFGYTSLARIYQANDDERKAQEMFAEAERITRETKLARDRYRVAARQAGIMLARADIPGAIRWSEELTSSVADYSLRSNLSEISPMRVAERIMRARVDIAQNNPGEAIQILSQILPLLEADRRMRSVIEVQALQALALQAMGEMPMAFSKILHALEIAEPEGFIRLFVDEGRPMQQLLQGVRCKDVRLETYTTKLLKAFEPLKLETSLTQPSPIILPDGLIIEALSNRELEVLRLVAAGYSNKEIAARLVLAVGTVKRHTANIFNKLEARNRTDAVARARQLNLI